MSERKDTVPEVAGLSRKNTPAANDDYYVPDYVMRDFGEADEKPSSFGRASSRYSDAQFLL